MDNLTAGNETEILDHRNTPSNFLIGTLLFLIAFLTILGNLTVVCAVFNYSRLREEVSSLFIVNLAITDSCTGLFVMLSSLTALISDKWVMGGVWCDIVCALNYCLIIVSMLTLCFIGIDRYFAVIHPFQYNEKITKNRVRFMITFSWIQGITFASVPVICSWIEYDYWEIVCAIQWQKHQERAIYYVIVAFIMCFFTPGVVIMFTYARIVKVAKRAAKVAPAPVPANHTDRQDGKPSYSTSYKVIFSLLIVLAAYCICMTPFSVTKLIKVVLNKKAVPNYVNVFSSLLQFLSSMANPFIYGLFRKDFRRGFQLLKNRLLNKSETSNDVVTTFD